MPDTAEAHRPDIAAPSRRRFDTLDLLRGVAAVCVLLWHFEPLPHKQLWSAYLSVDLFFVISGVVIAHSYEERLRGGWRPWRFLLTRIIRLWPLYLLGSAIGAMALAAGIAGEGLEPWRFKPLAGDVVRAAAMLPRLHWDGAPAFPLNRNACSLFCEFVVNIGFGFGGYRLGGRALGAIVVASAVAIGWGAFHFANWNAALNLGGLMVHLGIGMARATFGFPLGVLIYRAWRDGTLPRVIIPAKASVALFLLLLFIVPGEGPYAPLAATLAVCLACPIIVLLAIQCEPKASETPAIRLLGRLSYPIYAVQDGFYLAAALLVARGFASAIPAYVAAAVGTLALAWVAERWFDAPVRAAVTRLLKLNIRRRVAQIDGSPRSCGNGSARQPCDGRSGSTSPTRI